MGDFGENPVDDILNGTGEMADDANEKHNKWGNVGLGLLAIGLVAGAAPLAIAGGAAFIGSRIYKRFHAPTINRVVDEASRGIEE